MELWHWKDCKVNMAVLAYYYGLPGADDTFPPIAPEKLVLRPLSRNSPSISVRRRDRRREDADPQVHRHGPSRRNGTTTAAASISGGTAGRSRATSCCWGSTSPRRASTRSSAASSRPSTTASSNWPSTARRRAKPIDFFHDGVIHTAEIPLGTFELRQGPNELSAVVVGANPKAQKEYMFGLDYLKLQAVP